MIIKELENLIDEFVEISHKENAMALLAEKYTKDENVMRHFLHESRNFLDNREASQ